ncbi:hypothetical protein AKJ57_01950 [candidate division MSBL1 archaeon SCGC-AAA259A05]|uniref:Tryptophan synthase alpha chain n=1 Tax=candidate division MSBL1 archaeon SCGC-AAA259A05 TaxID=1698259 RepID=A0A133UAS8_9EURY|nr:hypothetical protein AKJ57_01950 [candidate division MSBL1 archaeon SCGC-AAA259A05]
MTIEEKFQELNGMEQGAYMPHIYYGDPSEEFSLKQVETLVENGADMIEFGIPFSDPTADGPAFQEACERALGNGITPEQCIRGLEKLREGGVEVPIIVTTYYNIPYVYGIGNFLEKLEETGVQGIIVPNLPIEEAGDFLELSRKIGINLIFQITPNTTEGRMERIVESASGFIYIVNFEGVTGVRGSVADSTRNLIGKVKSLTELPLMAGFGVSEREHAASLVSAGADGVITGSALGEIYMRKLDNPEDALSDIGNFASRIKRGCMEGYRKLD